MRVASYPGNRPDPAEALISAASRNAEMLGLGDRIGTIAPGFIADLLIVDGDPLADMRMRVLTDLEKIYAVFQGGRKVAEKGKLIW